MSKPISDINNTRISPGLSSTGTPRGAQPGEPPASLPADRLDSQPQTPGIYTAPQSGTPPTKSPDTALLDAIVAGKGDLAIIKKLIEDGAPVNNTDEIGNTAIHGAAAFCAPDVVLLLLDAGSDVHARNNDGYHPLHFAASRDDEDGIEIARILIAGYPPSVNSRTNDGNTPRDLAITKEMEVLLQKTQNNQ